MTGLRATQLSPMPSASGSCHCVTTRANTEWLQAVTTESASDSRVGGLDQAPWGISLVSARLSPALRFQVGKGLVRDGPQDGSVLSHHPAGQPRSPGVAEAGTQDTKRWPARSLEADSEMACHSFCSVAASPETRRRGSRNDSPRGKECAVRLRGYRSGTTVVISANKLPPQAQLLSLIQRPSGWGRPAHPHHFPVKEPWEAQ